MPVKAPAPVVVPAFTWSGCYIGAHVGGGWGSKRWTHPTNGTLWGDFDADGWLAGGQIGCDFQTGQFVFGIEGTGSWTDIDGSGPYAIVSDIFTNSELNWLATVTGRIGFAVDRVLFYVKGGGAWAGEKHSWSGDFVTTEASETRFGWLIGGGLEYAFAGNWSGKIEYNYIGFGSDNVTHTEIGNPTNVFDTRIKQNLSVIKVGLNYRFGGFGARY
jgi:outer membrane immunogenic protein